MGMTYIYILKVIKKDEEGAKLSIKDREKMKEETLFNETVEKCLSELELGTESPLGTSADATPPLKTSGLPAGSPGLSQIKRRVTAGSLSPLPQTRSSLGTTARIRVLNLQASQDIGAVSEEGEG